MHFIRPSYSQAQKVSLLGIIAFAASKDILDLDTYLYRIVTLYLYKFYIYFSYLPFLIGIIISNNVLKYLIVTCS